MKDAKTSRYRVISAASGGSGRPSDETWNGIETARIRSWLWTTEGPRPDVRFRLVCSGGALHVRFDVDREVPVVRFHRHQDPVYKDSCVEFFFQPRPGPGLGYFNFEVNAAGAMLAAFGPDRQHRQPLDIPDIEGFGISASIGKGPLGPDGKGRGPGGWSVEYSLPLERIESICGAGITVPGSCAGNFYKCGDDCPHPHYGAWNRIGTPVPDFHRPECFGILEFVGSVRGWRAQRPGG